MKHKKENNDYHIYLISEDKQQFLEENLKSLAFMLKMNLNNISIVASTSEIPSDCAYKTSNGIGIYLKTSKDVDQNAEKESIKSKLSEITKQIKRLESLLNSPFATKAPEEIISRERQKLNDFCLDKDNLLKQLDNIEEGQK